MIKTLILFTIGNVLSNAGIIYFMQIKTIATTDQTSVLYTVIGTLAAGIVTMYLLQRKDQKEREKKDDAHANTVKNIYDTVVKEVNTTINNNTIQTGYLKNAIDELRDALK